MLTFAETNDRRRRGSAAQSDSRAISFPSVAKSDSAEAGDAGDPEPVL
jgi:hypothetical protein